MAQSAVWKLCLERLSEELSSQQFNTWIRPIQAEEGEERLHLRVSNRFFYDWIRERFLGRIAELVEHFGEGRLAVELEVAEVAVPEAEASSPEPRAQAPREKAPASRGTGRSRDMLDPQFTFETFVEGKSNQLALAASRQVAENPGGAYNPLYIYGGTGLGKTHLMQAIGNQVRQHDSEAKVRYITAHRFVNEMVRSIQHNAIEDFNQRYRSLDVLLIDDIQFFAGKDRTQEELFHTFNTLMDLNSQIGISCDRYPKEVEGLEERLRSRFGWGLTVAIEPPELETRMAILMRKAASSGVDLPEEVAFFISERIQSNVRDLEGAFNRVVAHARFLGRHVDMDLTKEALADLLEMQTRLITIENIQKVVANYYNIRVADMRSKKRSRAIAAPRQVAMSLAKQLTDHSLPEIGDAFGGRDHTTVLYGCRKVEEREREDPRLREDLNNLKRVLTG
ncbi:chromosomal replication initiation protein [Thiohalorhabdus denitrificans]|uniref:Chromosomal replication initiator protein DnaA n=1 Tax=Thiohalorhabdus denitrificans TaxID=381306 RepID=A0A0P9EFV8_9GAMM|nr:chromosomal replication initiator protein DnaA [Thiohalorhabdus denitrificans]KPV41348.1 chromosomal replication initiation protein [Thiohalorhabdus denitrificans]SCY23957.1 chromosomal replication initiator protein DnaA [Thiohalorhabdus denitrificans]